MHRLELPSTFQTKSFFFSIFSLLELEDMMFFMVFVVGLAGLVNMSRGKNIYLNIQYSHYENIHLLIFASV